MPFRCFRTCRSSNTLSPRQQSLKFLHFYATGFRFSDAPNAELTTVPNYMLWNVMVKCKKIALTSSGEWKFKVSVDWTWIKFLYCKELNCIWLTLLRISCVLQFCILCNSSNIQVFRWKNYETSQTTYFQPFITCTGCNVCLCNRDVVREVRHAYLPFK